MCVCVCVCVCERAHACVYERASVLSEMGAMQTQVVKRASKAKIGYSQNDPRQLLNHSNYSTIPYGVLHHYFYFGFYFTSFGLSI